MPRPTLCRGAPRVGAPIHATFLKTALGAKGIPALTPNFSAVNFNSRDSVPDTARTFEDLGVAAYNGAAQYIRSATYLTVAGKVVSVEARHAAAIRDLLQPRSSAFAGNDVINANGLDRAFNPATVLQHAGPFIVNSITIINLPRGWRATRPPCDSRWCAGRPILCAMQTIVLAVGRLE